MGSRELLVSVLVASLAPLGAQIRICNEANPYCAKGVGTGNDHRFALEMPGDTKPKTVHGFRLYTRAPGGARRVAIALYLGKARQGPIGAPVTTGTIAVGSALGWYGGRFRTPVRIPAGQVYYLHFDNSGIDHPVCPDLHDLTTHWWRLPILPIWIGPVHARWAYREECTGGSTPGRFGPFGNGCPGTGVSPFSRFSPNLPCSDPVDFEWRVETAFEIPSSPRPITITSIGMLTRALRMPRDLAFTVHDDSSGLPGKALGGGVIRLGTTNALYSGAIAGGPLRIPAGRAFYVSFDATGISMPLCSSVGLRIKQFIKRANGWTPSGSSAWALRIFASGSPDAVPELQHRNLPTVGRVFDLVVRYARAGAPAAILLGTTRDRWNGAPLPLDLGPLGAPGCRILAAGELILAGRVAANGELRPRFALPADTWLAGKELFAHGVVLDSGANRLGVATTNGGAGRIGL